jgi:hypothetical protein
MLCIDRSPFLKSCVIDEVVITTVEGSGNEHRLRRISGAPGAKLDAYLGLRKFLTGYVLAKAWISTRHRFNQTLPRLGRQGIFDGPEEIGHHFLSAHTTISETSLLADRWQC